MCPLPQPVEVVIMPMSVTIVLLLSLPLAAQAASPIDILTHTPLWVFGVFALLLSGGIRAMAQRKIRLHRLMITPVIFLGWGLSTLISQGDPMLAGLWLAGALAGAGLAFSLPRPVPIGVDRGCYAMELPGSAAPLVRVLLLFIAKYGLGVAMAIRPDRLAILVPANAVISGLSAGYFLLTAAHYLSYFYATPSLAWLRRRSNP
jgi:hypothetical protein